MSERSACRIIMAEAYLLVLPRVQPSNLLSFHLLGINRLISKEGVERKMKEIRIEMENEFRKKSKLF